MVVFSLEHTSDSVRGILTRHMFEIRPGVFVGRISTSIRDLLAETILGEDPSLDLVIAYEKEGRIEFESYGSPTRDIADIEGMPLLKRRTEREAILKKFYAKAKPDKPLTTHLYETGKAAEYLLNNTMLTPIRDEITKVAGISSADTIALCSFLAAMHDIGKLAPAFQLMLKGEDYVSSYLPEYGITVSDLEPGYRHEIYSGKILREQVIDRIGGIKGSRKNKLPNILASHHQGEEKGFNTDISVYPNGVKNNEKWNSGVVSPFVDWVRERFPVDDSVLRTVANSFDNSLHELLTGIVVISDWIASGKAFRDCRECDDAGIEKCLEQFSAEAGIDKAGFKPGAFEDMFGTKNLRPVQETVRNIIDKNPGFEMMLIEAPMGEGKTNCGLYAAMHALVAAGKESLYVALPTGATSSTMIKDVNALMERLGVKQRSELLTHTSWLTNDNEAAKYMDLIFRKFKLFCPVATGTIDQIMTAVQHVFYNEVKLSLLATKAVLIDEIHAYDESMKTNIKRLLEYLHKYHVPVIMMSATMSDALRQELLSIYADDTTGVGFSYPMVTICNNHKAESLSCASSQAGKKLQLFLEEKTSITDISDEAIKSAGEGACVGIVVNTVKSAMNLYEKIKADCRQDIPVYLLHSRFPIFWKEDRIKELTSILGPDRKNRPERCIVITTQIIEMSVDVDFDCMYTQLAPSDVIMQRAGRVQRHSDADTIRERGFTPFIKVICPDPANEHDKWLSIVPYDEERLQRSRKVLEKYAEIFIPDNIPVIVNETYRNLESLELKALRERKKVLPSLIEIPDENGVNLARKQRYIPTRNEGYETITVFMGTDDELGLIRNNTGSKEQYVGIYGNRIVTTPMPKPEKLAKMPVIEGGCRYFDGMYDGRLVYGLDPEIGLRETET